MLILDLYKLVSKYFVIIAKMSFGEMSWLKNECIVYKLHSQSDIFMIW